MRHCQNILDKEVNKKLLESVASLFLKKKKNGILNEKKAVDY
jgi:hypothetical protein